MERLALIRQLISRYRTVPDDFSPATTFRSLRMDSYEIVDFMMALEESLGIAIEDEDLLSVSSIRDVENLINRCMKEESDNHA